MLEQFVAVMPGTLAPALLVMSLSVMLTVGEGRDKPISSHWRLIGLTVGLIAAITFAGLRASAVINQRTFVNYPVLWCAIIADILTIVVVVFARRITTNWQQHKVFMHIANAVAVANLMVASIGERSGELALLKALGATDAAVSRLMLAETAAISLLGAIVGALLGSGVAQLIGRVVFGSGITMRPMVFVLVFVLLAVTVLLASASSIRSILNLKPAEVLHGR